MPMALYFDFEELSRGSCTRCKLPIIGRPKGLDAAQVVLAGPSKLHQPQVRLGPVDSVRTRGIGYDGAIVLLIDLVPELEPALLCVV